MIRRWGITILRKHELLLKLGTGKILQKVKLPLLIGPIKCFGLVRGVQKSLLQNLRNTKKVYSKGETMVKKISKWAMVIPIKIVVWVMWPVAKAHDLLKRLSSWLQKKLS